MIAVFVARDVGEFKRYCEFDNTTCQGGFAEVSLDGAVADTEGAFSVMGKDSAPAVERLRMKYGTPSLSPQKKRVDYKLCMKLLDVSPDKKKTYTLIVDSNETIAELKQSVIDADFSEEKCTCFVNAIRSVLQGTTLGIALAPRADDDVRLFVHWKGGANPESFEEKFNVAISNFKLHKILGCQSFVSYAVSTRRPECFRVDGGRPIEPPCGDDEVERLIRRFDHASTRSKDRAQILKAALGNELSPEDELEVKNVLSKHGMSAKEILEDGQISLRCAKMLREGVLDEL